MKSKAFAKKNNAVAFAYAKNNYSEIFIMQKKIVSLGLMYEIPTVETQHRQSGTKINFELTELGKVFVNNI